MDKQLKPIHSSWAVSLEAPNYNCVNVIINVLNKTKHEGFFHAH